MIPDSLDFILRPTNDEQAEYAAAAQSWCVLPEPQRRVVLDERASVFVSHDDGRMCGYYREIGKWSFGGFQECLREHLTMAQIMACAPGDEDATHKTPASPTVPLGEAGPHSSDADAVGAPASGGPRWAPVDDETADLLTLVANQQSALPEPERQWQHFLSVMRQVARRDMWGLIIDQNDARELLRGEVSPSRVGAFYHRAACMGLIRRAGWNESDDRASRNRGKPQNTWEWLGATS